MDADGDGHLTRSELDAVLAKGGERMTRAELDEVMDQFDLDGDGRIDFAEFSAMLVTFSQQMRGMQPPLARKHEGEGREGHRSGGGSSTKSRGGGTGSGSNRLKKGLSSLAGRIKRRGSGVETANSASEAGSGTESGGEGGSRLSKMVAETAPEREPGQLRSWDCDRLGGTMQAISDGTIDGAQFVFTLHEASEVYLTLRMDRGVAGGLKNVDMSLFLLKHSEAAATKAGGARKGNKGQEALGDEEEAAPSLIAASPTQYKKDPAIRVHLEPGTYSAVPFTTGCKLRKRTAQPTRRVALTQPKDDGHELTAECRKALVQVFQRLDADGRGSVSRDEYSYLQMRTDGEPCDDETWE